MAQDSEVTLVIEDREFKVKKDLLCEYSDYFRAMFSGNYIENQQNRIAIDVVDASSVKTIITYMQDGFIDLFQFSLQAISEIALAANFLQITELNKQIAYTLEQRLSRENWLEIKTIAEEAAYTSLEQYSTAYGLLYFSEIDVQCIKSIEKLYWYLSHPYLDARSELAVFEFGLKWIMSQEIGADAFMLILCCLDMQRVITSDLVEMKKLIKPYELSLAAKVIDCLFEISVANGGLTPANVTENKIKLCEMFTETVYIEVLNLIKNNKARNLNLTAVVPFWNKQHREEVRRFSFSREILTPTPVTSYHYLYKFSEQFGFESWLEVAQKNLWGWGFTNWGPMRIVVVCGEHGRGTGVFMRDVKVYDAFKKEWSSHGVQLPSGRHAGLTILGDMLFIVGGIGAFRVVLDKTLIYDLKENTYREVAKFHDAIQNPALCTHRDNVYASGVEAIYRYEEGEGSSRWDPIVRTNIRMSCMVSFKGYIYCTQSYFSNLYRFRPDVDKELEIVANFTNPPATISNLGNRLLFFTRTVCGQTDALAVEEYTGTSDDEKPKVIWANEDTDLLINDVAGCGSLVMNLPPIYHDVPSVHDLYRKRCANMFKAIAQSV